MSSHRQVNMIRSLWRPALIAVLAFAPIQVKADHVRVFLLGGQSNMLGRAPSSGLPTSPVNLQLPQSDVLFYYGSSLTTLRPGSGANISAVSEFGPEVAFGRAIADASPQYKYALIKYAAGGTALYNDWAPGTGPEYAAFRNTVTAGLAALQAAGHSTEIVGMLWHQGENDAIEGQQATYQNNLTAFIADVRSHYGANLPFLIGEIRRSNGPAFVTVADAQLAVAAADPNAAFIPASDLGFLDTYHFNAPSQVTLGQRLAASYIADFRDRKTLSAGGYHVVRVEAGLVKGLGDGTYGQLGANPVGAPATVAGLSGITDVAAGGFSTLALKSDGTVWFLGETTLQQTTPHGTPNPVSTPVQVAGLSGIDAIAAGHRHFLALDTDTGNLYAWGHNGSGQVGNGGLLDVTTPVVVLTGVASMSAGDGFSHAVKTDQTLWAWGRNAHGQLGLGDTADRFSPTQVPGVNTAARVEAGGQHTLVLLTSGSVLAIGNNEFGQLGVGTTASASTPVLVPGLSGITALAAGYFHSAAFGPGNQISVWGRNFEGQCGGGNSSPVTYSSPQVLAGLSGTPVGIDCGYHFSLIPRSDGSVLGIGSNSDGQLDGSSLADQADSRKVLVPQVLPPSTDLSEPQVVNLIPGNGSSNIPANANLTITFNENVQKGIGSISIKKNIGNVVVANIDVTTSAVMLSGAEVVIDPPVNLENGTQYFVEITNGAIKDLAGNSFVGITGSTTWSFVTAAAAAPGLIPINNSSFEANENTDGTGRFSFGERQDFGGELTGWISKSGDGAKVAVGWADITASELHPSPKVGAQESQALSLTSTGSVLNTTSIPWSSLSVGDTLSLTISLGMRLASTNLNWNESTFFGLTDGSANYTTIELADTVANSGLVANNPATGTQSGNGTFTDVSFDYVVQAVDLTRIGNIGILISSVGTGGSSANYNQSFFDNVRLNRIAVPANDFLAYISNPAFGLAPADQGFNDDPDGDGIANGLEAWFGTHPGQFNAGLADFAVEGTTMTFTHPLNANAPTDLTGNFYDWCENLLDWYPSGGGPGGGPTVTFVPVTVGNTTTVTATASEPMGRIFVRARVTQVTSP